MMNKKRKKWMKAFCLLALLGCFMGCKDDEKRKGQSFDNNLPIEIVGFEPREVAPRTQLLIYGKNFGNDPSLINLKLGGVDTRVVNCNNECIYCMVPRNASKGTIEISIGDQAVIAPDRFTYIANTQVTTLCGYVDETGRYEVKDGPLSDCGLNSPAWLTIDPKNPNHIYMIENKSSIRLIDREAQELTTVATVGQLNIQDPRSLCWSLTGDTLFVSNYSEGDSPIVVTMLFRSEEFKKAHPLFSGYKWVISATIHPQTGDIYFAQESDATIKRYNMATKEVETMFTVGGNWIWMYVYFHPSGNFAYVMRPRDGTIFKCQFNKTTNWLEMPSIYVGNWTQGYNEGVGTNVRMGVMWQGVFVKNEKYVEQHKDDIYDFYVADGELWENHPGDLIWKVTPNAEAIRYAGRGSVAMDNSHFGYVDGDLLQEARFNGPHSIAFDEVNKIFYIGDEYNRRIRQIIVE